MDVSRTDQPLRSSVLALLKAGYVTQSEAASLAGVTRQTVHQWVRAAGLQPAAAREKHLRQLVQHASSS